MTAKTATKPTTKPTTRPGPKRARKPNPKPAAEPVTVAMSDQPATASMLCLGKEPACTPQCLLAVGTETDDCGCHCKGEHHGKLAHTPVPETRRKPPAERVDEPALFDVTIPDTASALEGVSA